MPNITKNDPATWLKFQDHPSFAKYNFSVGWREWYEGDDPDDDLALLRQCAVELQIKVSNVRFEFVVLDDLTTFIEIEIESVRGRFGTGCSPDSVYLHIDADPSNLDAPEMEVDNLSLSDFLATICQFIKDSAE